MFTHRQTASIVFLLLTILISLAISGLGRRRILAAVKTPTKEKEKEAPPPVVAKKEEEEKGAKKEEQKVAAAFSPLPEGKSYVSAYDGGAASSMDDGQFLYITTNNLALL